jgi:preprotein translocase subunit SecA
VVFILQFVHLLTKNYNISQFEANSIVEECVYATRFGESPNSIIKYLGERFEFESLESIQALMDHVVFLMNNTREWFLKGHTSTELSKPEKKSLLQLPKATSDKKNIKSNEKVSRNDSCPCGSGKKYKKCCGR